MELSLSDQYRVRPEGSKAEWSDVDFIDNGFSDDMGDMRFSERINSSIHFHSPDCTAFGNLRKR